MTYDEKDNQNYERIMLEENRISFDYIEFCNKYNGSNTIPQTYRSLSIEHIQLIENDPHLNFDNGIYDRIYSNEKGLVFDSGEEIGDNPFIIDGNDSNYSSVEFRKEFFEFIEKN
jgi:hypothetical protein